MSEQKYVLTVENSRGDRVFVKKEQTYNGYDQNFITIRDPQTALSWSMSEKKQTITDALEKAQKYFKSKTSSDIRSDTIRLEVYEWSSTPVSETNEEWQQQFRETGLSKLTHQEIVALGVEQFEVFRRLKATGEKTEK